MFLENYLSNTYIYLVYSKYDEEYLNLIDEKNFSKVYMLLKNKGFYFIDDIILNYLELFEIHYKYVELALSDVKSLIGEDYVKKIGLNLSLLDRIISLAIAYNEKE